MFSRIDSALCWLEDAFIASLLLSASVIIFVNVVLRYIFNTGFIWAEEFVRYEIVWLVFIGGSVAARKGIHIGVEAVLHVLPAAAARALKVTVGVICIAFCAALVWYGAELVAQTQTFRQRTSAMQAPFWIVQLAVPIGAALMLVRFAERLWFDLRGIPQRDEREAVS
jgi:C4-dicarboxylate transporter DctQ subunit